MNAMNWVIEHLQIIIGVAAAIAYYLNRRRTAAAEENTAAPTSESLEREERTRQIQAEIRRKIAERRAETAPTSPKQIRTGLPPMIPPTRVPPIDPFGGPMRKILKEIERAAQPEAPPQYDPTVSETAAVLERQKALQEQLRTLEAARAAEQRRAAEIVAARHAPRPTVAPAATFEPGDLRARLRDPKELRRTIVMRELLGPPVALR
jgi:hypothetical protein